MRVLDSIRPPIPPATAAVPQIAIQPKTIDQIISQGNKLPINSIGTNRSISGTANRMAPVVRSRFALASFICQESAAGVALWSAAAGWVSRPLRARIMTSRLAPQERQNFVSSELCAAQVGQYMEIRL